MKQSTKNIFLNVGATAASALLVTALGGIYAISINVHDTQLRQGDTLGRLEKAVERIEGDQSKYVTHDEMRAAIANRLSGYYNRTNGTE